MSKKKASGGSTTMTLKDFHGGSIPSDLPLPSAPGVIARPTDRPGFDRQGAWGNPMGRSDRRLRPGSAGAVRNIDDKTPFLNPSAHIGRNFDEDERKPLDGVSGPRRTVSDESVRALPTLTEPKPDYSYTGTLPGQQVLPPASHLSSSSGSSYAGRVTGGTHVGVNSQNFGGNTYSARFAEPANVGMNSSNLGANTGQAASGMHINTRAIREETVSTTAPLPATWSGPNAASKLAHASALEKVSSGRWQSKQSIHHPTDVEVIRHTAIESEFRSKDDTFYNKNSYHPVVMEDGVEYHGAMLAAYAQRSLTVDGGIRVGGRELPTYERARSPIFPEAFESNPPSYVYGPQPACDDSKFGGSEFQSPVPSDHPKLKPLLSPKPLEILELPVNSKMGYQKPHNSDHLEYVADSYASANSTKSGLSGSFSVNRAVERPKLNLKPRSQPIEQLDGNIEKERNSVFGGARPRELVLKERRIDDAAVINNDVSQPPNRVVKHVPRTETVPTHATPTRYNEKAANGNTPVDNRIIKNNDMQDNRVDGERADMHRRNWRSENRRNNRETEKERPPSPETWRKPAQQPKPASADVSGGLHLAKAASAVELAEAFSRSISDPKTADRFSGQRGVPSQGQMLFSRLMSPTSRPQINGY